jgi:hypothetical protein
MSILNLVCRNVLSLVHRRVSGGRAEPVSGEDFQGALAGGFRGLRLKYFGGNAAAGLTALAAEAVIATKTCGPLASA